MKKLNSFVGWSLLVAVLAVPTFLFYNWWAGNSAKRALEMTPGKGNPDIFTGSAQARPEGSAPPVYSTVTASPSQAAGAPAAGPAAMQPRSVVQPPAAAASFSAPAVSSASARVGGVSLSTAAKQVSYYNPKTDRDPTLSPEDSRRIKEAQDQLAEAERRRRAEELRRSKSEGIEGKLRLQGIVGNAVIINGEMYRVGQTVYGAKIIKIGDNYMIGEYKGKQFRKVLK